MKKIAIVITNAYSYAGTENICNYMTEYMGDDAKIDILSLEGGGETFYPYNKANKIVSFSESKRPFLDLKKTIIANEYACVFVVSMGRLSFAFKNLFTFNKKIRKKTKFVACEHIALDSFSLPIKIIKILALRWYDVTIVLTDIDNNKLSICGVNSIKINNPINYQFNVKVKRSFKALAVGRLSYQKGFDNLLDIWKEFIDNNESWILKIAGDGELMTPLKEKAKSLNIDKSVQFLGKVDSLNELYSDSDFLLMTSRYEGLPMVLLEAKSWSLPVIAYDCPTGPREIVKDNVDGFLVPNLDSETFLKKMNLLAENDEKLYSLSKATEHTYTEFDSNTIRLKWLSLIK